MTSSPGVPATPSGRVSLGRLALRGSAWTLGGNAAGQVLRLGGNLVLTRLLFPEAFGLMALVQIAMNGVRMFSDVGLRGSVVQHPRGDDAAFLNTVWTFQILRGLVIFAILTLLAWPMSLLYEEPRLRLLVPIVAFAAIITGFASTAIYTLVRQVRPAPHVALDLGVQAFDIVVIIVWAWFSPTVWALVAGALAGPLLRVVVSHRLIPGYRNRLGFDRSDAQSIFRFGRWIFLATAATFVISQGDRVVLGKFLTLEQFGVYSVAFFLAQALTGSIQLLSGNVLFPVYSRLVSRPLEAVRRDIFRVRRLLLALSIPVLCVLAVFGDRIVDLLYDSRYADAGWMLQILAVGMIGSVVALTAERILTAKGNSFGHMVLQVANAVLLVAGLGVGGFFGGVKGMLWGASVGRLLSYVPLALLIRPYGLWMPRLDAVAFLAAGTALGLGFWMRGLP